MSYSCQNNENSAANLSKCSKFDDSEKLSGGITEWGQILRTEGFIAFRDKAA